MTFVSLLTVLAVIYVIGRFLSRYLGWPTDLAGAGRWGLALLGLAVLFGALPDLAEQFRHYLGPLPQVELIEFIVALGFVGLGVLGYVAWSKGKEAKGGDTERLLPRRRAVPPPPSMEVGEEQDGFAPVGAEPGGNEEGQA